MSINIDGILKKTLKERFTELRKGTEEPASIYMPEIPEFNQKSALIVMLSGEKARHARILLEAHKLIPKTQIE
jgi:hypothetical protein